MGRDKEKPMAIPEVTAALVDIFSLVAYRAARDSGFVQRQSKLGGEAFVQALTFGWLQNPRATLEELTQAAASVGVRITPQGLEQRFGPRAADCLQRVLQEAVARVFAADPVATRVLQRFPGGVCLLDSTTITLPDALSAHWPGCGGTSPGDGQAALKLFARWNLLNGELQGPFLYAGRVADQTCEQGLEPLPPGTLRLADLGFFSLDRFQEFSAQGVYWLTRVQPGTVIYDATQTACRLADVLSRQGESVVDLSVALGVAHRLPCRLIAVRVPDHVAEKRRERLRERQKRKGRRYRNRAPWVLAEWTVFATNVPADLLSVDEVLVLGRCRWQIELLWKLWKSEGVIDESRSTKPWRVLTEVYAKLLGMVVQHWILLTSCWSFADRSLVKASRLVRVHALNLAMVLPHRQLVRQALQTLQRLLQHGSRVGKRKPRPPNHELLRTLNEAA
jgi:hypothetical protein